MFIHTFPFGRLSASFVFSSHLTSFLPSFLPIYFFLLRLLLWCSVCTSQRQQSFVANAPPHRDWRG
jgi:hypothetical protein